MTTSEHKAGEEVDMMEHCLGLGVYQAPGMGGKAFGPSSLQLGGFELKLVPSE
jgi:hypothetical protein